ncbi:MAG: VCBS repeat-containing protein [Planctomycetales bacterium]|nr:VCBS repeat-containing protein [Planctomycetales bacterium]
MRRWIPIDDDPTAIQVKTDSTPFGLDTRAAPGVLAPKLGDVPAFELQDQDGRVFGLDQMLGKITLVNFIFTRCTSTCPTQSERFEELQSQFRKNDELGRQVQFASITVDPEHDDPGVLKAYAERYHAHYPFWRFLSGSRQDVRHFAKEGLKMPVEDDPSNSAMPILHETKIVLVDRMGRIRGYFDSLTDAGIRQLMEAVNQVMPEIVPPSGFDEQLEDYTHISQPPGGLNPWWLESRQAEQLTAGDEMDIFHGFTFRDQLPQSGISFHNQIVDDQRWRLQVNHYDHGNGIAVADVDGDGYLDIYFTTQVGSNELWRNKRDGSFENVTKQANVGVEQRVSVAASFADVDNDGDPDLFVTTVRGGNLLFENDGSGAFKDISTHAGVNYQGHSSAAVFFDYDLDGLLDLFVVNVGKYTTDEQDLVRLDRTNHIEGKFSYYVGRKDSFAGHLKDDLGEASILYHNEGGGVFKDVTTAMGIVDRSWSGAATPLDANQDGWPDLYILSMQGPDHYFENVRGTRFVDRTAEVFPKTSWGAMGVKAFDFNNDGRQDLYVTDMHSDMSEDIGPEREKFKSRMQWPAEFLASDESRNVYGNSFFLARDDGKFREVSDSIGAENYWPWGLSVGDVNADGFEDAFLASSMCFPYRYAPNSLLLNSRGERFIDSEYILGIEPRRDGVTAQPWFELDCEAQPDHPFCRGREGRILVWSAKGTRSAVIFDIEQDGDLDIVTNEFNAEPQVLVSDLSERKVNFRWCGVRLRGTKSNRDGLGARVTVLTDIGAQYRLNDGQSGYLSQSSKPLYFGLGDATAIKEIVVEWPSGTRQSLVDSLEMGTTIEIEERIQ